MNLFEIEKARQIQADKDNNLFDIASNIKDVPEPKNIEVAAGLRTYLNKMLPPQLIIEKQKACLNAITFKQFEFGIEYTEDDIAALCKEHGYELFYIRGNEEKGYKAVIKVPNYEYIDKALDKLYRLLGEYAPEKHQIQRPLADMSEEELDEIINKSQMAKLADRKATIIEAEPN